MFVNERAPAALITGASGGIGYELAKLFAKDHHDLALVARNGPRLAQVADELQRQFKITVKTLALDLTEPPLRWRCSPNYRVQGLPWTFW